MVVASSSVVIERRVEGVVQGEESVERAVGRASLPEECQHQSQPLVVVDPDRRYGRGDDRCGVSRLAKDRPFKLALVARGGGGGDRHRVVQHEGERGEKPVRRQALDRVVAGIADHRRYDRPTLLALGLPAGVPNEATTVEVDDHRVVCEERIGAPTANGDRPAQDAMHWAVHACMARPGE